MQISLLLGALIKHYKVYMFPLFIGLDEELPDYIMVMVANKKTSQQMADDLSLFLGNNTIKFTAWYHQKQKNPNIFIYPVQLHSQLVCPYLLISKMLHLF